MPTPAESKRLATLQSNYQKPIDAFSNEKLNVRDLLLLLQHDAHVRSIILDITHSSDSALQSAEEAPEETEETLRSETHSKPAPRPISYIQPAPQRASPQSDTLRAELAVELHLLELVTQDAELARAWLGEHAEPQGRQLVRLIAVASQWNQIQLLWDRLAERCRTARRPASAAEQQILEASIALHNLIWDGKQAKVVHTTAGTAFDHDIHERGTPTGELIHQEWLPGLINAAGNRNRKVLAATS